MIYQILFGSITFSYILCSTLMRLKKYRIGYLHLILIAQYLPLVPYYLLNRKVFEMILIKQRLAEMQMDLMAREDVDWDRVTYLMDQEA